MPSTSSPVEDDLLQKTIYNDEQTKNEHCADFDKVFEERWDDKNKYFQTYQKESLFAKYSSQGWKIHITFQKGKEKEVAKFLYKNGLYFKIQGFSGTYFNGMKESGATIYIGSYDNMQVIADYISKNIGNILTEGLVGKNVINEAKVTVGSGADIEVLPGITARLDIQKTQYGEIGGNYKYAEKGLDTQFGLGGIPILQKYEKEINRITENWNKFILVQQNTYLAYLKMVYEESKNELVNDFGEVFVFGESSLSLNKNEFNPKTPASVDNKKGSIYSSTSSPTTSAPDTKGGIAFNALPIQTESVVSSALGYFPGVKAFQGDLEAEWTQIQAVFNAGIRPSVQRISEYTAAACASPLDGKRREDVLGLIAELLRREEEDKSLTPTTSILKNLLVALEAG